MSEKIPCYVSYRRVEGNRPPILKDLVAACPDDIELKIDDKEIEPGDNFTLFMKELMSGGQLLFLLSKRYFLDSRFCVAEMLGAVEANGGQLSGRAYLIDQDGWFSSEDSVGEFRKHWQGMAEDENGSAQWREIYRQFVKNAEQIFAAIENMAAQSPEHLIALSEVESDKIWTFCRLRMQQRQRSRGAEVPDSTTELAVLRQIEEQINSELKLCAPLHQAVLAVQKDQQTDPASVVHSWVGAQGKRFGTALGELYRSVEQTLRTEEPNQRITIKTSASRCYFALLRKAVNKAQLQKFEKQRLISLLESSVHVAELVIAGTRNREARYTPGGEPENDLGLSRMEWGNHLQDQLDGLYTYLWNRMAPVVLWEAKNADAVLTTQEKGELADEFRQAQEDGDGKYICVMPKKDDFHIFGKDVRDAVFTELDGLDVVHLGDETQEPVLALQNETSPSGFIERRVNKFHRLLDKYPSE